ncbi:MAG: FecR domain-containing protein [Gloeobacteraceae cyanobacterium ES-bin-144]|nr:FecR domain-containing protein [Verrucomicrobiales bacterium]
MKFIIPFFAMIACAAADGLRSAKLTQVINDVQVYSGSKAPRQAAVDEKLSLPSSVQTGRNSRTELTFNDSTITRLGQNSVFSFTEGGRNVELKQGSVLLQVPKNAGGATIRTATVTAAITGTTVMFECSPGKWIKSLTLEGTQKLFLKGSKKYVSVPAGMMIIMNPDAKEIPEPIVIDLKKLIATSPLAGNIPFGPLPPAALEEIKKTLAEQLEKKRQGILLPTDYVISGSGQRVADSVRRTGQSNRTMPEPPSRRIPDEEWEGPYDGPNQGPR